MRLQRFLSFLQYIAIWLLKKSPVYSPVSRHLYHLLEVKQTAGQYKLFIQEVGKPLIFQRSPQEVAANDKMLEGFSKKEIRRIVYLAFEQSRRPKYRIVMQEFCDTVNRMLFKLKKQDSSETISKTASQISLDKYLINNLSQEDVCSIGYMAGYEQSYLESLELKKEE